MLPGSSGRFGAIFLVTIMVGSSLVVASTSLIPLARSPSPAGSDFEVRSGVAAPALGSVSGMSPHPDEAVTGAVSSVGNGNDWYADAPSGDVIGVVTGSFPAETGITSEVSANGPGGGPACPLGTANCYGLQINTNSFPTTYASSGGPISTNGSEQFVYQDSGSSAFMGIWEILFGFTTCPSPSPSGFSSWDLDLGNCYAHTPFVTVPAVPVTNLSQVTMTAYANQSANDALVFCVAGACTATSGADAIGLSQAWTVAEFNVFGDNGGSQAAFDGTAALQVQTQIATEGGGALVPTCAGSPGAHTVEDNNMYLWPCSASSGGILFWEANESFGLSPTPANVTVQAGLPANYSVGFTSFAGTPAPVQLTVTSPLPPGVTQSFPATVTPPSSGALTLATSPITPLGDYAITVQAQIAGLVGGPIATTTVGLHIFNFTVSISPGSQTVLRGFSGAYTAQLSLDPGSTIVGVPPIVLSDPGLPADSSVSGFSPAGYVLSSLVPANIPFTVQTALPPSGSLGDFPFSVVGTAQGYEAGASSGSSVLHIYDYTVAVIPSVQTVLRGANPAIYYLDFTLVPGSSTVGIPAETIVVSGLPAGTPTPTLSASTIAPTVSGCSPPLCPTLTVTTAGPPSGPLGDSTFSVMGVDPSSGGVRSSNGNLHIFDFVSALTPSESLFQGESITVKVSLPLDSGSTTIGLPIVSLTLTGLPSGVVALGFPSSLIAGGSQTFTLETGSVGGYVSCPQVSDHGFQNLQRTDLAHCDLAGYNLIADNLQKADLSGANLADANLGWTNLQDANLSSANTSGTDFQWSNLQGVDLSAAGPVGKFTLTVTATVDGGTRMGTSILTVWGDQVSGDNFQYSNLQGANFGNDLGIGTNFWGVNLQGADLAGSDVQAAGFQFSNLQSADLAGADLQGAQFQFSNLQRADLAGTTLTGLGSMPSELTDFNWANLQNVNFAGAVCGTPNYITAFGANLWGASGIPTTCSPPLDPPGIPTSLAASSSPRMSQAAMLAAIFSAEALAGIVGALLLTRRFRRPQ